MSDRICARCKQPLGKGIGTWLFRKLYCTGCLAIVREVLAR